MGGRYMQHDDLERILDGNMKPTDLPLALLQSITDNFSEARKIGAGGFGMVYKGVLRNGNVAVKKIMNSHTIDEKLFRRELSSLMKVNHHNAVRFLGFCSNTEHKAMEINGELIFAESRQRLLCFEYISNGSLDKHITDELRGLEWSARYHIIKGICEGLHHLHKQIGIIHMDLKPANILLNDHMVPKITDFGLSRLEGNSATLSTHRFLSLGYCAPEYLFDGKMSVKSDMYSLGVIIIELVTGEKGIPNNKNDVLRRWRHRWNKSATGTPLCYQQVTKCIDIGVLCLAKNPDERPLIWEIIDEIKEMGIMNEKISSVIESTVGQVTPYSDDDMLGVEPLEIRFPCEFSRNVSCSLELTNETDAYIAFNIETMSPLPYCTGPEKGTVPPRSKCVVSIKLEPHEKSLREMQQPGKFIVWSTKVNEVLTSEDISKDIFSKDRGNVVDKVNVYVVFDTQLEAPCLYEEQEEDLPAPALAVSGIENVNDPEISDVPESSADTGPYGETDSGVISVSNESVEVPVTKVDDEATLTTIVPDALPQLPSSLSEEPNEEFSPAPLAIPDMDIKETGQASDKPQSSAQSLSGDGQVTPASNELLDIQPLVLCFPFQPNKAIPCSVHLRNNRDEIVVFRLMAEGYSHFLASRVLYGVVLPRSTYQLVVTTEKQEQLPEKTSFDFILQSSTLGDEPVRTFESDYTCKKFFEKAKETDDQVHELTLKAISTPQGEITSEPAKGIKMLSLEKLAHTLYSVDSNQTKQWIITGHMNGHLRIWNYRTQRLVDSFKISRGLTAVRSVKFIARKQWFAAASLGFIHVYSYETKIQRITSFRAHACHVESLSVHPAKPYMLSSAYTEIKLWDWDKGWECIETFKEEHSKRANQVVFNPMDTNSFATASGGDHTLKIWSLDSPKSNCTLFGHSDQVNCLDFFEHGNRQYLISGSNDQTARIWDLDKKKCVQTLEAFMSAIISVSSHPTLPLLLTGLENGVVSLWSSTNFRLERILNVGCSGPVIGLSCFMGSRRVAIGQKNAIAVISIDNVTYHEELKDSSERTISAEDTESGDTTSEVIPDSIELLGVHPLNLFFPFRPEKSIPCSLNLTNNTDEHVAFRIMAKPGDYWRCFASLPLYGTVPPRFTYTLIVTAEPHKKLPRETEFDVILQSSIPGDKYIHPLESQSECDQFFEEFKEMGKPVHELRMKAVLAPQGEEKPSQNISVKNSDTISCLDVNLMEPWIITGHTCRDVSIWNYDTQIMVDSSAVKSVDIVKFIARKQWFVAASSDGFIHAYKYGTEMQKMTSFRANTSFLSSLVVHPTHPCVLSSGNGCPMKLWDWDKGWECTQTFDNETHQMIRGIAFNPKDTNIFASASANHTVQVWSLDSPKCKYTLAGHSDGVNCLSYFSRDEQLCLISGSDDRTAKIWEMQKKECVQTLEAFMSPVLSISSHPSHPVLIMGLQDGTVHFWRSTDFRLQKIINIGCNGPVRGLAFLPGSKRVAIGQLNAVSIVNIDNEEYQ